MRTGGYAKITIAQVFSSTAISFLFQLKKKIANALRIKRERQKGKQLFSSLQGKKYSAEKRRPNRSQKCKSFSDDVSAHFTSLGASAVLEE